MMDEASFKEWLEEPATEYFMKYLKDSIDHEADMLKDQIISGGIATEREQAYVSAICATLEKIVGIDLEEIDDFYSKEEE